MPTLPDRVGMPARRPLIAQVGWLDAKGNAHDGVRVVLPTEPEYESVYQTAVLQWRYGKAMPYVRDADTQ